MWDVGFQLHRTIRARFIPDITGVNCLDCGDVLVSQIGSDGSYGKYDPYSVITFPHVNSSMCVTMMNCIFSFSCSI